ncbi:MAG: efflux RND transporter permease subunit [Candidatus Omnitrophica bacterium]|nr:efflux RND transporter permease subunit [Candidatus Omnitrophota bacterium]
MITVVVYGVLFLLGFLALARLPSFSIRRPVTVTMVSLGLVLVGAIALTRLPIELYPNFSFGDISIIINIRGGMPPVEVESRVTKPIEEAVGDVTHMKDIISISEEARSRVVLTFEPGTDMDFAALEVREKFSKVRSKLPPEIEKPIIAKFEQTDQPILIAAVTALNYTPEMLRRLIDEEIKEKIFRVEGVANVEVGGGRERKILVEVDLKKLQAFRLPIDRVTRILNLSNLNLLSGEVDQGRNKYLIRAMGEFGSLREMEDLGLAMTPSRSVIRLKDVATVKDSFLEATSYARVNTLPVVSMYIQKETTANTVKVAGEVMKTFERIKKDPRMPRDLKTIITYNQAVQIQRSIDAVGSALIGGAVLAILVLGPFLGTHPLPRRIALPAVAAVTALAVATERFAAVPASTVRWIMSLLLAFLLVTAALWRHLRLTLIVAIAIPLATVVTFGMMFFQKLTLNIMTLGGLAMGIGMLVDNSIVVLDNIIKHRARGEAPRSSALTGATEMLLAIVASTFTTIVVLFPIVFVNKEIRLLYTGFALTISYALIISLFVALSVVPLLASRLDFPVEVAPRRPLKIRSRYRRFLMGCFKSRWPIAAVTFFVCLAGWQVYQTIPKEFLGTAEAEDFTIFVELPSGAKLEISDQAVAKIEKIVEGVPEVKSVSARVEPWSSKVYVKLLPLAERSRSTKDVIDSLRPQVEEAERSFREAFIYFEEPHEVETNEVIVEIYGWDYEILNQLAVEMLKRMQAVPGLTDLKIRWRRGRPEWLVRVDKVKAARFGLTVEEIANALHAQMRGLRATLYHTEGKEVEVVTRLQEEDRATLEKLRRMTFTLPSREVVFLEQVARLEPGIGPSKIWRKNHERMIQVSANRGRYAFGEAAGKVFETIKGMPFPKDYYWRFGENYWRLLQNQKELRLAFILSLVLIYLVLASLFESYSQPLIIGGPVPLALVGATLSLKFAHQSLNVGALMGMILLGGVVVNNAIILVDEINRLRLLGVRVKRAVLAASLSRVRPIAMTSLTTIIGLLPLALSRSEESSLWSPMAMVVIGGMVVGTVLTPIVTPGFYLILEDLRRIFPAMIPFKKRLPSTGTVS